MKTKYLVPLLILLIAVIGYFSFGFKKNETQNPELFAEVKKVSFTSIVNATGELQAKKAEKIKGPQGMRQAGVYSTNIKDMVPEGTLVKKGDFVANLDRSEIVGKISEIQTELDRIQTQMDQAVIDTAIELRGIRDELYNLNFSKKAIELQVEQNKYEPQSVIQQTRLDVEKLDREYRQLEVKLRLTRDKSAARIMEIVTEQKQKRLEMQKLENLSDDFTVIAPHEGMIIYSRTWSGKIGPGSQISYRDPIVAELPDMSDMISKSYVNEVDISKVRVGQDVTIKVDAFPDKEFPGQVKQIANIGEQLRNYDAKVFEVVIQLHELDSILRPAMTTSNEIYTESYSEALVLPLESVHKDSLSYVYIDRNKKIAKQEVLTGAINETYIIIGSGVSEGDKIYLSIPNGADDLPINLIDLAVKNEARRKMDNLKNELFKDWNEKAASLSRLDQGPNESAGNGSLVTFD